MSQSDMPTINLIKHIIHMERCKCEICAKETQILKKIMEINNDNMISPHRCEALYKSIKEGLI